MTSVGSSQFAERGCWSVAMLFSEEATKPSRRGDGVLPVLVLLVRRRLEFQRLSFAFQLLSVRH